MFDRSKPTEEASASSAQGIEKRGFEDSLRQESSSSVSIRGSEQTGPGLASGQNRQGYCNCCRVHYRNLEQHVISSQHRHFTTYCRNRMGTTSLMERFLQDVLHHHPHRYHDNRPTYDDMPPPVTPLAPRDVCLLPEGVEEKMVRNREEMSSKGGESIAEKCSPTHCQILEGVKEIPVLLAFTQKPEGGKNCMLGISQQPVDVCTSEKRHNLTNGAQITNSSHEGQCTTVSPLPHHLPVSSLSHSPPVTPTFAKNIRYSATLNLIPSSICDQTKKDVCSKDGLLNRHPRPVLASVHSKTPSVSHQSPTYSQGNSLCITSGQTFFKQDGLQSQDETLSDFHLRDMVETSRSLNSGISLQLEKCKDIQFSRGYETSVDEIIEEVILKYCHGSLPRELPCKGEESNSFLNISSLLSHSQPEGSEMSFDCDAPVQSGTKLPKASIKDIEFLKEVQINLEDKNYGTQLSCVLKDDSVEQVEAAKHDIITCNEETVLPDLPYVPPSFVGKTWSQIMYEDDRKIEALVRDFKEGRFRCYFDSESSTNCPGKRMKKKKQKDERKSDVVGNKTEAESVKALPEFNDALSTGSTPDNPSLALGMLCNTQIPKMPRRRTWRLASRCQVVKVSHATQTSLVNYPVVKRKFVRKKYDPPSRKTNVVWPENERTPNMKTRLCALKLPESYSKIMSPLQPKTVVYVLSCPEIKQFKGKPIHIPKMRKHNSTDGKDSVRYKYKQCSLKYYDPLTNRILKMPPKSTAREGAKKPPHVRQLFRSLSLDANLKKLADAQKECTPSNSFNFPEFCTSSSVSFLPDPVKGGDMNSNQRTDGSSVSTERSDYVVSGHSEKSYKHTIISPLSSCQSQMEGDIRLTPFSSRVAKTPVMAVRSKQLEKENPKPMWKRKEGSRKEPGFSKKPAGPMPVRHVLGRKGGRVTLAKQTTRTKKQQKEGIRKLLSCAQRSSVFSIHQHQLRKTAVRKHLKKENSDAKKLQVTRKPKRTFLNSTVISGIPEKRQKVTAGSFPKKPDIGSSRIKRWEINGDKGRPSTVNRPSRRTASLPLLGSCLVLPGKS